MADLCLLPVAFFPFVTQIGKFVSKESYSRGNYTHTMTYSLHNWPSKTFCSHDICTPLLLSNPQQFNNENFPKKIN